MASINLQFHPSSTQGQEGTLFFRVVHHRASRMFFIDCRIYPEEWDEKLSFLRPAATPERKAILKLVASEIRWYRDQLTAIIREKEASMQAYKMDDIVRAYKRLPACQTWFQFIRGMTEKKRKMGRLGTAKTYQDALSSFFTFRGGEDLLPDNLCDDDIILYEAWLKERGLKLNSSSCYLRTLRTLYRKAVEVGLTTDKRIFRHVYTGFAKTPKRALPLNSVRSIRRLPLPAQSSLAFARDIFLLSLYLQGMSFVDMAWLKKDNIRFGQLQYSRRKTRQSLIVSWEPSMQNIVDRYAHLAADSPYLLPILCVGSGTENQRYLQMLHKVNRDLKLIGEMVGLQIPLTTYVARHTWASTMRDMGCDLSIISAGLGHESLKTTQIYLSSIDSISVMKANKKMIESILK